MPPTPSPKTSNGTVNPATLKREAKAMLTSMKDVERNIARYTSPPDPEGMKLVQMQLRMLQRQHAEVMAVVDTLAK